MERGGDGGDGGGLGGGGEGGGGEGGGGRGWCTLVQGHGKREL